MNRKHVVYIHLAFWFYILLQHLFPIFLYTKLDPLYYKLLPLDLFVVIIYFYIAYLLLYPLIFRMRFKIIGIPLILASIAVYGTLTLGLYYLYCRFIILMPDTKISFERVDIMKHFWSYFIFSIYCLFVKITVDWLRNQKRQAELQNQNQASELALLRSQINPHFLFNTLNNIYSLVRRKSENAPAAMLKLSEIMRYMLYDANVEKVPLEKELNYLNSFIELQKLRVKDPNFVIFNIEGDINNRMISPMMLIPFVENAFKHSDKRVKSPGIDIHLKVDGDTLHFEVMNYLKNSLSGINDEAGGIGLQNIRRRLELIYPGKHLLEIIKEENRYIIRLDLEG